MMTTRSASSPNIVPMRKDMLDPAFCSRLGNALGDGLVVESLKVRPMRRRPGSRHVFSCELIVGDQQTARQSSIQLVAKRDTTRAAGKAAKEFKAIRLLWEAGFGLEGHFKIPRPVQHFPDLRLILQGKARGLRLRTYLGKGNHDSLGHVCMAGLWLAKLHNLPVSPPQMCGYANEIASLRVFVEALSADRPELSVELQQRAADIEQSFAAFQTVPATLVHGDFHPDHIFVNKDGVTVIDFERFGVGDPARDLGSFIAHMRTTACFSGRALHAADHEINAFLASYFSAIPLREHTAIASRIAPYVALSSLEALYYVASVLKIADPDRIAMYVKCVRESCVQGSESAACRLGVDVRLARAQRPLSPEDVMTRTETRIEKKNWKQRQEGLFGNRDFVARRVVPLVPELARGWDPPQWNVEIARSKATDRITLRYTFGRTAVIYGKVYFDPSVGRAAHSSLAHLWKQGFAAGSGLEIPEPLGFIEEANLLLMRRAEGTPLSELTAGSREEALTAARLAARWLAKYHATEIPGLPVQPPCERIEILKIADALAKVAAECPRHSSLLIDMLHHLHAVAPRGNFSARLVPLHGQFRPAHVFTDGVRATVIDIEKICLSDPSKDVARFVHVLKKTCFEQDGNAEFAALLAQEFIAEYQRLSPSSLENLAYFRALLSFKALAKLLKSHKVDDHERRAIAEMYRIEFEQATHGPTVHPVAA